MEDKVIYLDNAATTACAPEALAEHGAGSFAQCGASKETLPLRDLPGSRTSTAFS